MVVTDSVSKGKQVITISSSSEVCSEEGEGEDEEDIDSLLGQTDEEDDDVGDSSEWEDTDSESQDEDYDDEEFLLDQEEDLVSTEGSYEDDDYESVSEDQCNEVDDDKHGDRREGKPNDEELCDRVINLLLRRNKSLDVLKLEECKAYLRKHELMISGTKATCIQRILEHWRLKDGNVERFYPKSSFNINCRGDVCKGDVVMFKQRVYEKLDKVARSVKITGKRTIAGRVVRESYGDTKQQHTFTIEVLWSNGVKPLPPLYPLLVKGRNLYRYMTFRQHWRNETERAMVLEEKHRRGAIARHVRTSTRAGISTGSKRRRGPSGSRQHHNKRLKKDSEVTCRKMQQKISFRKVRQKISGAKAGANSCSDKKPIASASSAKHSKKPVEQMHGAKVSSAVHRANACYNKKSIASASSDKLSKKHGAKASSSAHTKKLETKKPAAPHSKKPKAKPSESHYKNLSIKASSCAHPRHINHSGNEAENLHLFSQSPPVQNIDCNPDTDLHRRNIILTPPAGLEETFHIPSYNRNPNVRLAAVPHMVEAHHFAGQPFAGHAYQLNQRSHYGYPYLSSISQHASSRSSGHFSPPVVHDARFRDYHFHERRQH